jgi:hypothetical protein
MELAADVNRLGCWRSSISARSSSRAVRASCVQARLPLILCVYGKRICHWGNWWCLGSCLAGCCCSGMLLTWVLTAAQSCAVPVLYVCALVWLRGGAALWTKSCLTLGVECHVVMLQNLVCFYLEAAVAPLVPGGTVTPARLVVVCCNSYALQSAQIASKAFVLVTCLPSFCNRFCGGWVVAVMQLPGLHCWSC